VRPSRLALAFAAASLLAAARPAAADNAIGIGADWFTVPQDGGLMLSMASDTGLAQHLTAGGRIGALLGTGSIGPVVAVDGRLRFEARRLYVDGLVGPWIFFDEGAAVRLHGAIGFGMARRGFEMGLEVGWVDPTASVGVRLAWRFSL
jgi:hypothetical protein